MTHTATIVLPKRTKSSYQSILGKARDQKRGTVSVKEDKATITIIISAEDATALRASFNSLMRDIQAIEGTVSGTEK